MLRRADRLFRIVEYLKARRTVVTADELADELEVGVRTIYRDIADLRTSGVPLTGEAGVGYLIDPDHVVRPLQFDVEELDALSLGAQMVQSWADPQMAQSAKRALDKIISVLPTSLADEVNQATAFSFPSSGREPISIDFTSLRHAIRGKCFVAMRYVDEAGTETERRLRPLALYFFAPNWLVAGWCEKRQAFRNFRLDRIREMEILESRFEDEKGKTLDDLNERCRQEAAALS